MDDHYQCPLGKIQPNTPDAEADKRNGWVELSIFVMPLSDPRLDWADREALKRLGDRIYGQRK